MGIGERVIFGGETFSLQTKAELLIWLREPSRPKIEIQQSPEPPLELVLNKKAWVFTLSDQSLV